MSSPSQWQDFKEQVRLRTDLIALINETVTLQPVRGGHEFIGLCPFHDDHSPSMRVYPERQSFRCWACQTGGDCFEFVMRRENVSFREALEMLALRARLELPTGFEKQKRPGDSAGVSKSQLYDVLGWAENVYHDFLINSPGARHVREYLAERGVRPETIARYKLGFHPANWEWLQNLAKAKFSKEQLVAAGLIKSNEERGGYYDFFTDRVMFPIHDPQGQTVAFGGRILPGSPKVNTGKYKNSPEGMLFSKSRVIYGLNHARQAITDLDTAIVMEGYMDCIMAQQAGIANCCATLGTALTEQHVTTLKRFARHVVLVFDGDDAGQNAAEKSLPRFLAQEVDLRILTLTEDKDPADAMLTRGADWFREQAAKAPEVWEFKLKRVIERFGIDTVDGASRVLEEMLQLLCEVPAYLGSTPTGRWQMREDILLGKLFQRLGIPEKSVRDRLSELRRQHVQQKANMNSGGETRQSHSTPSQIHRLMQKPTVDEQIEAELLQIVLLYPETVNSIRQEISTKEITCPALRQLWELCLELLDQQLLPTVDQLLLRLEQSELKPLIVWLDETARLKKVSAETLGHTLHAVRRRRVLGQRALTQDGPGATSDQIPINAPVDSKTLLQQALEKQRRLQERRDAKQ